jgi:7-cyano-7-deazaguanine synthase in queuosine biosynthesis
MCGIAMFFARESVPDYDVLDTLFTWSEKRGIDGFGIVHILRCGNKITTRCLNTDKPYSEYKDEVKKFLSSEIEVGDIIVAISRALPETESPTSKINKQPIENSGLVVVHNGAVTKSVDNDLRKWSKENPEKYSYCTSIDSESILASYVKHNSNIKDAMEYISGGFASIMVDLYKKKIYLITDFKPLAHSYIRGVGYFVASDVGCLREVVQKITHSPRDGMNLWEDWYAHYLRGGRIKEIDIDSGMTRTISYNPRYITQSWESSRVEEGKELCLVSASGGLDSSMTLAILKFAGYENIIACHFTYGHRGQLAESLAIRKVTEKLGIPLKILDLKPLMKEIDTSSMLIDESKPITTGTNEGLKRLEAWVNGRNMLFLASMAALAESEVMKHDYEKVHLLGGFLNLTESGVYPDNAEYFLHSFLEHTKYGTLIGNRLSPLYCLSNLMKSELFTLIKAFKLEDIYAETISCDRPKVILRNKKFKPYNCSKNGIPACGSGLLSYWGAKIAGVEDKRRFYEVEDDRFDPYVPEHIIQSFKRETDVSSIINRILLPEDKLENLRKILENK